MDELGNRRIDYAVPWSSRFSLAKQELKKVDQFLKNVAIKEKRFIHPRIVPNASQVKVIERISATFKKEAKQALCLIIGEGGTGKSTVIKVLRKHILAKRKRVRVCSFTGTQAHQLQARTIHSLFGLTKGDSFKRLGNSDFVHPEARNRLALIDYIIIDEIYLLGLNALQFINKQLQNIKGSTEPFGKVNVILAGDIGQLDCVADNSFFAKPETLEESQRETQELYRKFEPFILEQNHRAHDTVFIKLLKSLRYKQMTEDEVNLLRTRLKSNLDQDTIKEFDDAVQVFPLNEMCFAYNKKKLLGKEIPVLRIVSQLKGKRRTRSESDFPLYCYEGAKVVLTTNICVALGLTNGRVGTIVRPIFASSNDECPKYIIVQFEDWPHPTICGGVPIPLKEEDIKDFSVVTYKAKKFPLITAEAVTLFRLQGTTLDKLVINFTAAERFVNYSYCAVSRVRNLQDILIADNYLNLGRFSGDQFMRGFEAQREELERLGAFAPSF